MNNIYQAHPAKILNIRKHTNSEWSFLLDYPCDIAPGKFVMVSLPGAGEAPISISGFNPQGIELTIRKAGKVTFEIFKTRVGDYVYLRGPYGNTFPVEQFLGQHLLVIAGGSGVAAVKSVIEYYHRQDSCLLRQLDILIGFRSPSAMLFKKELKSWAKWSKQCNVVLTVDADDEDEEWQGGIGFVMEFIKHLKAIDPDTLCIVVGPPKMMTNTVNELFRFKVKPQNIWLSFERHMKCGVGKCGHCRIRDKYICSDGPVFNYQEARRLID